MKKTVILIAFGFLMIACGGPEVKFVPLGSHDYTTVSGDGPVTLINAQQIKNVQLEGWKPDLEIWTDQAIEHIKMWLEKNDIPTTDDAEKILKFSITEPKLDSSKGINCTRLTLNVETGTGIQKKYPVEGCASGTNRATGYAVNYSVVDFIHDSSMIKYISGTDRKMN